LATIVGAFKSFSAREINRLRCTVGAAVWQRGFHEHVVRSAESLDHIRRYITNNPAAWAVDRENSSATETERKDVWRI
jgi:REP element-mobilizing transposase RayT